MVNDVLLFEIEAKPTRVPSLRYHNTMIPVMNMSWSLQLELGVVHVTVDC